MSILTQPLTLPRLRVCRWLLLLLLTVSHTGGAKPFSLSDGRHIETTDWTVVLFMQGSCRYCQEFDPALATLASQTGLSVYPFTLDGQGDTPYPYPAQATPEVMVEFFGNGLPIATPTTFLVNVHTMQTYPLYQGAADIARFKWRLDEVFRLALDNERPL